MYVQKESSVKDETGIVRVEWIKKKRGRVRMALGIPGPRGKAELVFPEKGHVFPISGQLRVV